MSKFRMEPWMQLTSEGDPLPDGTFDDHGMIGELIEWEAANDIHPVVVYRGNGRQRVLYEYSDAVKVLNKTIKFQQTCKIQ